MKRLAGDTAREATSDEVKESLAQARQLRELVGELMLENRLLKKRRTRRWGVRYIVPAVREPKGGFVRPHDIKLHLADSPSAN